MNLQWDVEADLYERLQRCEADAATAACVYAVAVDRGYDTTRELAAVAAAGRAVTSARIGYLSHPAVAR